MRALWAVLFALFALPALAQDRVLVFAAASLKNALDEANAAVPRLSGTLDGSPFDALYDADERFGTILEVFGTGGVYTWLPLEEVQSIVMNPPRAPRDVLLRPASITLHNGVSGDVLLPGLYPDTHAHPDDEIKLGRGTEWLGADDEPGRGAGGRLLVTGGGLTPLSAVSRVLFVTPTVEGESPGTDA